MTVLVFDIGKSNLKLHAIEAGTILATRALPNPSLEAPPYRHHDAAAVEAWLMEGIAALARAYPVEAITVSGHGSAGALVDEGGLAMPMIDYEGTPPPEVVAAYAAAADPYLVRGSPIMLGAAHQARQMLWLETAHPGAFARARHYLGLPQYWAWRLSGVAASEVTILAAQSHLWDLLAAEWAPIVARRGWERLMAPLRRADEALGPVRPDLARRLGLVPGVRVYPGIHDSSANFHRYRAAGFSGFTLVSTGTWIVALCDRVAPERLAEGLGMTLNADIDGGPVGGALTMAGREFARALGSVDPATPVEAEAIGRLVARGTMMLPSWGAEDGLFPGSAGRGRIVGPAPEGPVERRSLVALYVALLALECASLLAEEGPLLLDGSYLADPLFAPLVAGLAPRRTVACNPVAEGVVLGAAILCTPGGRTAAGGDVLPVAPLRVPGLEAYRAAWRAAARS